MDAMEDKIGSILSNPQMMQQIMSMAQALNQSESAVPAEAKPEPAASPDFDPAILQKIVGLAGKIGVDQNQKALLSALRPYLTATRIQKLEKAMRAAKLASAASAAFSGGALSFLTGR